MNIKLNKNDILLIIVLLIISIICIFILNKNDKKNKVATVYYNNELIKTIDLNIDKTYEIEGYNGIIKIKVKNQKIKVLEEKSPLHLCSKSGYISKSYETIVCLPNKVVIEIEGNDLDTVVK